LTIEKFIYSTDHIVITNETKPKDLLIQLREHDTESFDYSFFTGALNFSISKEYGLNDPDILRIHFEAGLFHDIGKLGMEKNFINYPGAFTFQMYNEMKKHALGGGELLARINAPQEYIDTANYHHCNFDGSGYPGNLFEEEIPFVSRLTRISDSIDAYLSKRCYKEGGPANEALNDVMIYSGVSYDPKIIDAFSKVHKNVIEECHKMGEDRPSKKMYMHYLVITYLNEFEFSSFDDILEKF
jgi:putative nucleotidyltransferase with HDIG domain